MTAAPCRSFHLELLWILNPEVLKSPVHLVEVSDRQGKVQGCRARSSAVHLPLGFRL